MADEKAASGKGNEKPPASKKTAKAKPKKAAAKKSGSAKKGGTKKTAAKKPTTKKSAVKGSAKQGASKGARKTPASKPRSGKSGAKGRPSQPNGGLDKSVAHLRDSLEHSVTLSRERIQEVVDDAVKRGRMTHGDAEKMIGELLKRGRKQTDALLSELEKLVRQARRRLP